jgi:phosphatidate phosphatase APP1
VDKHLPPTRPERADSSHRASRVEDSLQSLRATQAVRRGKTPHVIPYTGYGSTTWMRVLARVLLLKPRKTKTGRHKKIRGWRSFLGIPLAGAVVTVKVNGSLFELEADRGGVIDHPPKRNPIARKDKDVDCRPQGHHRNPLRC